MATAPLEIAGRTGLQHFAGLIDEERHPKLRSLDRRIRTYQEMSQNDAVIGAILHAIDMLVRQVDWTVEAASGDKADQEAREFVESCMLDMSHSWEDLISEVLSMLTYGFAYFEIVYKRRQGPSKDPRRNSRFNDGKIGWRKISIRSQDTLDHWEIDDEGGIQGMWQNAPPTFEPRFIPIDKALLFRTKARKGNPEGASILRTSFRSWYLLRRIQEIEAIGIERDLAGLPVLEVPPEIMHPDAPSSLKALRSSLEKMIAEVRRDEREGLLIPAEEITENGQTVKTGYKFRLQAAAGSRQINTNDIITRYEQRIAMSVLAEFIMLGMDKVGSFALASSKTHLFAVALGAWLKGIAEVFNRFAIPRLFALNGFNVKELPRIVPGDIEVPPLDELGTYLSNLAQAGLLAPGDKELERRVRQIANLPEPPDEDEPVGKGGQLRWRL